MTHRSMILCATALSSLAGLAPAADLSFTPVPFPADDAARRQVVVSPEAVLDGQKVPLSYSVLARSGDKIGPGTFGQLMDAKGQPLAGVDPSAAADFTSLLPVGGKIYALTHFEELPGALYLSEVAQAADGKLSFTSTQSVDLSSVGGLWDPCAGSVTPWGTHLGSEEYPMDARALAAATTLDEIEEEARDFARYFGLDPKAMTPDQFRAAVNPYRYGFPVEYRVSEGGRVDFTKHGAMGRVSVELANVLADQRTAYITDDGTNVGLFRFVADKAGELSAGQLYAARFTQTSAENGGAGTIDWVDLGHADDASVEKAVAGGVTFADLFETGERDAAGACAAGFTSINAGMGAECLKVKPGMEMAASRLETRRYAALLGATTEFRKMEGSAYDPDGKRLFIAMTEIGKGMTDGDEKADKGGPNAVRLPKNQCGAVYELPLGEDLAATEMRALVVGQPKDYAADAPEAGNSCDVNGISSPDNLTYLPGLGTLVIAEDTDHHQNDAIWAFKETDKSLTRIATTPYGAEATSVDWYPNLNGHAYLMAVVQHPYGETDEDKLTDKADARAYVGYIGPFPAQN